MDKTNIMSTGGIPEVPSVCNIIKRSTGYYNADIRTKGNSSPTQSPPLGATAVNYTKHSGSKNARARRGGAAFTITEECERLFCETLKTIFLGEGDLDHQDSLVMETELDSITDQKLAIRASAVQSASTSLPPYSPSSSSSSLPTNINNRRLLTDWLEMYDYTGGARFRGYIADGIECSSMFVFFDKGVLGNELKPG
jgi:hypothetical protein